MWQILCIVNSLLFQYNSPTLYTHTITATHNCWGAYILCHVVSTVKTWYGTLLFLLHHMAAVIFSSNHLEFDSRQVLCPPTFHQHHIMLLQVVSLPRDEHHSLFAIRQPHSSTLSVCRIGFLGLSDHGLQDHCLQLGTAKCGTSRFWRWFWLPLAVHLVEGGHRPGEERSRPGRGMLAGCRNRKWQNYIRIYNIITENLSFMPALGRSVLWNVFLLYNLELIDWLITESLTVWHILYHECICWKRAIPFCHLLQFYSNTFKFVLKGTYVLTNWRKPTEPIFVCGVSETQLPRNTKMRICNSMIEPVLSLFSSSIQSFINTCLRRILRVRWPNTISNLELWQRTGHTLFWNPQGKRKGGRPRNSWHHDMDADVNWSGQVWGQLQKWAQDQDDWRPLFMAFAQNSFWKKDQYQVSITKPRNVPSCCKCNVNTYMYW